MEERIRKRKIVLVGTGFVGMSFAYSLLSEKGINELVAAFLRLYALRPAVRLLLVGAFEDRLDPVSPDTKVMIMKHPAIRFVGWQDDIRPYRLLCQTKYC